MVYKICRICCKNESTVRNIFEYDNEVQISAKIMYCCGAVSVIKGDGLPAYICGPCERDLQLSYGFVLRCEDSDKKLRSQSTRVNDDDKVVYYGSKVKVEVEVKTEDSSAGDDNTYMESQDPSGTYSQPAATLQKQEIIDIKLENQKALKKPGNPKITKRRAKSKQSHYVCSTCGQVCSNSSTLVIHLRKHTDEKPYPCLSCNKKYKDSGSLRRHIESNHMEKRLRNYVCESCGKGFFRKYDVKIHMRVHTKETPYSCPICPKRFTQISGLQRHEKRHTGERSQICSICNKKFCTKSEVTAHLKTHSDEKEFPCPICNVLFKYKSNLKKHIILHSQPNSFVCNYCGRTFSVKGNLKIHIDKQHSDKSGYCNTCFKSVPNIEVHNWRHTGQRPLKCEMCTSTFYELKALTHHINFRHKKSDKFKCTADECTMAFPSKPMLEFHKAKFHDNVILFPCDSCSRGFYRKSDLARHKIGSHKDRLMA